MNITITLRTDNAAFEDPREVGRVLGRAAGWVQVRGLTEEWGVELKDTNGNAVGELTVSKG